MATFCWFSDPHPCFVCGSVATVECKECYKETNDDFDKLFLCTECSVKVRRRVVVYL